MSLKPILVVDEQFFRVAANKLNAAKTQIRISNFKMEMSQKPLAQRVMKLYQCLWKANERGCRTRILLNILPHQANVAGSNISVTRILRGSGCEVRKLPGNRCCHAKMIIIDHDCVIVGSHNWTTKALTRSFEVSILLSEPQIVENAIKVFDTLWEDAETI